MPRKQQPRVSVVIPNYNRAVDLRRCLDSLVAQTFDDFEVLVCDDGSTDNSAEVAADFADRLDLRFETAENFGGPARPRNRGIALARAPFVAFLDSDDWWMPDKLANSLPVLESGADVVYHDLYIVRSHHQQTSEEKAESTPPRAPMFQSLLCTGISIPNSSAVVRKCLLEQIGGVCEDRDLISVEDYDTWLGLARLTERFVRLNTCDGYYWVGGDNISSASPKQQSKIRALYARHLDTLPSDVRPRAAGFLAYRVARIAQQHGDFGTALSCFREALAHPIELRYRLKAIYFSAQAHWSRMRHACA
jgi:glycosyltransferase involved in cell wall biosynthesis